MTGGARRVPPWILVLLVALGIRLAYVQDAAGTPGWFWHTAPSTAMAAQSPVVTAIRSGDLAARSVRQPLQSWQRTAGSPQEWERLCGPALQDPPGGYYLRAIGGMAVGGSLHLHKVLLALFGALACAAIGAAGTAVSGPRGGVAAGLLAAVYGPLVAADGVLLGDVPALGFVALAAALVMRNPADLREGELPRRMAGAGAALAIAVSLRSIAWIPALVVIAWLAVEASRRRLPRTAPALCAAGFLVASLPFAARDLAAGAPPLAPPCASVARFAVEDRLLDEERPALPASRLSAIAGGIGSRLGSPSSLVRNVVAAGSEIETPDSDFSFEYLRQHSTVLFLLPRYSWMLMLSFFAAAVWPWNRRGDARPFRGSALIIAMAAAGGIALAFAGPSARMRLPLLLPVFVCAGWFLGWVWDAVAKRDWTRVARATAAILAVRLVWLAVPPPAELHRAEVRLDDFVIGSFLLAQRREFAAVDEEFGRAWNLLLSRAKPEDSVDVGLRVRKGHMLVFFRSGEMKSAEDGYDALVGTIPDDPLVREVGRALGKTPPGSAP